jgi:p-aminobenzoyl-glutamate transporter AbgT
MRKLNKRGVTGLQLVMGAILYFVGAFIFFSFLPTSILGTYSSTNDGIVTNVDVGDNVTEIGVPEDSSTFDVIVAMTTFDIVGLPTWMRLLAVVLPLLVLGLGIYGLVRGI